MDKKQAPPQQVPASAMSPMMAMPGYGGPMPMMYGSHQLNGSPSMYTFQQTPWGNSPSLPSNAALSFSPTSTSTMSPQSHQVPQHPMMNFPDSPPLPDAAQILLSPTQYKRRRSMAAMMPGFGEMASPSSMHSPMMEANLLKRSPVLKVPVSPKSGPNLLSISSPKQKGGALVLPFSLNRNDEIVLQGPATFNYATQNGYWEEAYSNAQRFLQEVQKIDEENITIIEIKQMLRKYGGNATGKKELLMHRLKTMREHVERMQADGCFKSIPNESESKSSSKGPLLSSIPTNESTEDKDTTNAEPGESKDKEEQSSTDNTL